jgi:uncharacterized protein YndB with AHSA1/START domain
VAPLSEDALTASRVIEAPPEAVFAVLANPAHHATIDGTGWVRGCVDGGRLRAPGQVFRMAMYHPDHPDGDYEMANRVQVFDPPTSISWEPGYDAGDGTLAFGGWVWRYDLLRRAASSTIATLTYDWSAVLEEVRDRIGFPPFPREHLTSSLRNLAGLLAP